MTAAARCPALVIAACASGQGKTTVTAALARLHARRGRRVRVFKCGPDYLDPHWHQLASGAPVGQLDLWMTGAADCAARLHAAAREADLILIEGVMGLFDGEDCMADLAWRFGIPVLTQGWSYQNVCERCASPGNPSGFTQSTSIASSAAACNNQRVSSPLNSVRSGRPAREARWCRLDHISTESFMLMATVARLPMPFCRCR